MGTNFRKILAVVGATVVLAASGLGAASVLTNSAPTTKNVEVVTGATATPKDPSQISSNALSPVPTESESAATTLQQAAPMGYISDESAALKNELDKVRMTPVANTWIIRSGAPIEEFPVAQDFDKSLACLGAEMPREKFWNCMDSVVGCTPVQRDWLDEYGILVDPPANQYDGNLGMGDIRLRNTASSSQSISIKDFRLDVSYEAIPDAGYDIVCNTYNDFSGGAAVGPLLTRVINLPLDGGSGFFGETPEFGEDVTRSVPEGAPAVLNLAAGEAGHFILSTVVPEPAGYISGKVSATVSAAEGQEEVVLDLSGFDGVKRAYSGYSRERLEIISGTMCPSDITRSHKYSSYGTDPLKPCSVNEFLELNGLD